MISEEIEQLLINGEIKAALETIIRAASAHALPTLKAAALTNMGRLATMEAKHLQGLIRYEQAELIENQIRAATVQLMEQLSAQINADQSHDAVKQSGIEAVSLSLFGSWHCEYYDPYHRANVVSEWILNPDYTYRAKFNTKSARPISETAGEWSFNDNIIEQSRNGRSIGKGMIQWITKDKFIFTIVNNRRERKMEGIKKIYTRVI